MRDSELDIRAVIFDMDGVLIDARGWHFQALNQALKLFGAEITLAEHLDRFDGLPTRVKLTQLSKEGRLPVHVHQLVNRIKQERTLRIAAQQGKPNLQHLILMGWLKSKGIKLGVATNSIRLTTEFMLQSAGLLDLMDCVLTNEDVEKAKPNPDIYLAAASALGVQPGECLVVEDSETGVTAATLAGMKVARVGNPSEVNLWRVRKAMEESVS